jgi:hypothetical protein
MILDGNSQAGFHKAHDAEVGWRNQPCTWPCTACGITILFGMKTPSVTESQIKPWRVDNAGWVATALLLALSVSSCSTLGRGNGRTVVAGLTLYECPEPLTGKLLFLVDTNRTAFQKPRRGDTATVYECNLADRTIRNVTSAPNGVFVPSAQGDTFAVHWAEPNPAAHTYDIKAWGYSEHTRQARSTTLYSDGNSYMPGSTVVVGESAFFDVWSRSGGGPGILRFNFSTGEKTFLELPRGTAPAQHQAEDNMNVLHVQGGWRSWYGFDVLTGQIAPVNCTKELSEFRCPDGGYVLFEGSEAPINGFTLVSSPADSFHTQLGDVDRKRVRVLKQFSRLSGGDYSLNALSPCGRYALVCHNEAMGDGWGRTYYVINASSGDAWVLLKDEVCRKTGGSVSWVWWLKSE